VRRQRRAPATAYLETLGDLPVNAYKVCKTEKIRGGIEVSDVAGVIAMAGPVDDLQALHEVQCVMKARQVFARDGGMTPMVCCHVGPVHGWRIR
jgi:hypothetical protein